MPVAFSRYPAMVRTSDGTPVNRSAVVVVDGRALLAVESPKRDPYDGGGVQVIATLDDVTVAPSRREATLTAADGQTWTVTQGDGCSCRNALSEWLGAQIRGHGLGT